MILILTFRSTEAYQGGMFI